MRTKRITLSFYWSDELGQLIKDRAPEFFTGSLVGDEAIAIQNAVNQGIDAHLEACYVPDRGDSYDADDRTFVATYDTPNWKKGQTVTHTRALAIKVSRESLPVLVRRLMESEDEAAQSLAGSICDGLNIELV